MKRRASVAIALLALLVQSGTVGGQQVERRRAGGDPKASPDAANVNDAQHAETTGDAADLPSIERRMQAAYETVAPAIVRISYGESPAYRMGTGIIVSPAGHVITSSGCVRSVIDDELLTIDLSDGRRVRGRALGWCGEWALGMLKLDGEGPWPHVELGDGAGVAAGGIGFAVGYPNLDDTDFDRRPAMRLARVNSSAAPLWMVSSCMMNAGASGLFDLDGRLLGVTTNVAPHFGGCIHTNVEQIKSHWDDLAAGRNVDRDLTQARRLPFEPESKETLPNSRDRSQPSGDEGVAGSIEQAKSAAVRIVDMSVSGTIVTPDGYVLTCAHHAVLPGRKSTVMLPDGRDAEAVLIGVNPVSDVGLMKITDEGPWPYAPLGTSSLAPGEPLTVIGYPVAESGREPWIHKTHVVEPTDTLPGRDDWNVSLWTDGYPPNIGGASGGGVFDRQGRVVAFVQGGSSDQMNHVRVELLRNEWDELTSARVDAVNDEPLAELTSAFRRIAVERPRVVVQVRVDGQQAVLGTVVRGDGLILTKASELTGKITCRLPDGRVLPAAVRKKSPEHDLALLKVDASGLAVVRFSEKESFPPGTFVAALLLRAGETRPGVVSLPARPSPAVAGGLGVRLRAGEGGLEVERLVARFLNVPLRKGDVLVEIDSQPTPSFDAYEAILASGTSLVHAGDPVRVKVRRGSATLDFDFLLPQSDFLLARYGLLSASRRWWGFPSVFSTDIRLVPKQCGAPVIDLDGEVVGIAIATRTQPGSEFGDRYVIPAAIARDLVADLP